MKKTTWRQFGYLEGLRKTRNWARLQAKSAKKLLEQATKDFNDFGMYDDCGPSYESEYQHAKGALAQAVRLKIQMEKFYTFERERLFKLNIELKKRYPKCIENHSANVGEV